MRGVPIAIEAMVCGITDADARFKPPSGAWSILEVVCHLCDEESLDFRARIESTLRDPGAPWPLTDPEGWATERRYNEQDLAERLKTFARLRSETVAWLSSLTSADWTMAYHHPRHGPVAAGTLMVSWPAHDALHIRQIAKRLFEIAGCDAAPCGFETRYAGEWGA